MAALVSGFPRWIRRNPEHEAHEHRTTALWNALLADTPPSLLADPLSTMHSAKADAGLCEQVSKRVLPESRRAGCVHRDKLRESVALSLSCESTPEGRVHSR